MKVPDVKYLLSSASRAILSRLSEQRTLCAFDFDGTLAPIVGHPDRARMRERTRKLLARVAAAYPCVILSGRSRADLLGRLGGVPVKRIVGNHGAETQAASGRARRRIKKWKAALEREIGSLPGLWIEDKGLSLAVHYRQSPRKAETRRRILQAARHLEQVKVFGGKQVVNLAMDDARQKGGALAAERDRLHCTWVLFVGDDENDEEACALRGHTIPVRVGQKRKSHAQYYLRTQSEIDTLLELLAALRIPDSPRAARADNKA